MSIVVLYNWFEELMNDIKVQLEESLISFFIRGFKLELRNDLWEAFSLARI